MTTRSFSYTRSGVTPPNSAGPAAAVLAGWPAPEAILGRAAGENFQVASRLVGRNSRDHLLAIYGFARLVDYVGDDYPGDRQEALDRLADQTETALADPEQAGVHPLIARVARSVRALGADPDALRDLITANRQDQVVSTYRTFGELVDYCRLSANPIGRLVLATFDATTPEHLGWSDRICTGLQLAEHWQDVGEDARAGRIYLPADDMARFGVTGRELRPVPPLRPPCEA